MQMFVNVLHNMRYIDVNITMQIVLVHTNHCVNFNAIRQYALAQ